MRANPIVLCFILLCSEAVPCPAQSRTSASQPQRVDGTVAPGDDADAHDRMLRDMAKKANLERQAAIRSDTEKLLKLAEDLKADVEKTNENMLSLDVLKKAEEIEKLALSVKDKMRGPN